MNIRILGAHNYESATTRLPSLVVDGVLAMDAGALSAGLSLEEQEKLQSILITHRHFDHIRDIATLGLATMGAGTTHLYSIADALEAITAHLINGVLYPKLHERPSPDAPSIQLHQLEPLQPQEIMGYHVLPIPVNHSVPTVGYQVTSSQGKRLFYTSDTGPASHCWQHVSPDLIVIETTLPNGMEEAALASTHLTPQLLQRELEEFQKLKGYIPPVVAVHLNPYFEDEIQHQIAELATILNAVISVGYEDMLIKL